MAAKILAATQNINADKQNQLKITHSSLIFAAVVCVYWYSMLYDNIGVKILSMKIFFQIMFVWEENDLVFSSELEKTAWLNSLRYTYVFKIHVCTYSNKVSGLIRFIFETLIFNDTATIRLQVYTFGVESFTDG